MACVHSGACLEPPPGAPLAGRAVAVMSAASCGALSVRSSGASRDLNTLTPVPRRCFYMSPTYSTVASGVGDWRDPFIGPLGPCPARLAEVVAILRCLISALITLSSVGSSVAAARSGSSGVITEREKGTYHRLRLNLHLPTKPKAP